MGTLLTEYNEEAIIKTLREDGYVKGVEDGSRKKAEEAARSLYANGVSIELIAKSLGMTIEQVKAIVSEEVLENA